MTSRFETRYCVYPCHRGFYGDSVKQSTCSLGMVQKYQKRISGPMLDRFDIHVEVPRVEYDKLTNQRLGESSTIMYELKMPDRSRLNAFPAMEAIPKKIKKAF